MPRPPDATAAMLDYTCAVLREFDLRFGNEKTLQDDVEKALTTGCIDYEREKPFGRDRIDFLTSRGVGIECKVDGGPSPVLEQLLRYAARPDVKSLILVTSRHTHRFNETTIGGKPFAVVWVAARLF